MKYTILTFGVLFAFSCTKTETPTPPPPLVVQEELIRFSTNLDTGTFKLIDTLPLTISVSTKIPTAGIMYSITSNFTDSGKQIFKLDTTLSQASLTVLVPGFTKAGNYSLNITVVSKSTNSNLLSKSFTLVRNHFSVNTTTIPLQISDISSADITSGIDGSVSGTIYTTVNGKERLTISPTLFFRTPMLPSLNFIKNGSNWALENAYTSGWMGAGRNYELMDSSKQVWAIGDHGLELSTGKWPFGSIYVMKSNGESLTYSNISTTRCFYHSVSTGDLNNDGLKDIVGLNMGTNGDWYGALHPYLQNADGSFSEARDLINDGINTWSVNKGAGAVLVVDILGDKRPEIIRADYGFNLNYQKQSDRYSFVIYSYDNSLGKYTVVKNPGPLGVFSNNDRGTTSIKAADFDNDGDLDFALATEGTNFMGIEVWQNDGQGNFTPTSNKIEFSFDQMQFREFNVMDINNDGWLDIVLNPFAFGKLFRVGGSGNMNDWGTGGVYLNNLFWMNNKGSFSFYNKSIIVPTIKPVYFKSAKINGQFKLVGVQTDFSKGLVNIYDIPFVF